MQGVNQSGQTDTFVDVQSSSSDTPAEIIQDVTDDNQQNETAMENDQEHCLSPLGGGCHSLDHDLYSPSGISDDSPHENGPAYVSCIVVLLCLAI